MSTTTGTAGKIDFKPALWTPGDWNAFFGFGTNILVNMLVLTGLLRFVLKMPDTLVFGRILPALGLMMCLSTFYYAFLAYRLAQKTGRTDVCALPSGVSVPHMFIVTFVIMLPITIKTGDPMKGWSAGLVWVFFQSFMLMIGGFIAPYIRKITPRAALLGTLAGVAVTFISMRPALEMYMTPQIGLVCFAIILVSWFGGVKYPKSIPAGLVAIVVGMIIAWGSNLFGLHLGGLSIKGVGDAFANFGFSVPLPAVGQMFSGFEFLGVILVTAIPFGIYDLVEAMDNVESAEAAGDEYPTTRVLTADGVVSLIGCLMGNPFINAVYIGHPGWKAMGGRIGYSAVTGIMVVLLSWFGIISVLLALVPVVAISPILLYIGMLIGAQAFQTTPIKHAPAIVLALMPHLAAWAKLQIDTMLGSTINAAQAVGGLAADKVDAVKTAAIAALPQQGVLYHGLEVMGGGSILAGLILGAIGVFVIDREFNKASAFAFAGAILTYFGFMHGESVGIGGGLGVTPSVALAYAVVAIGFFAVEKFSASTGAISSEEAISSEALSSHAEIPLAAPAE
jgi:AGZA family xanthine/uracil permease-like MFS transporter